MQGERREDEDRREDIKGGRERRKYVKGKKKRN